MASLLPNAKTYFSDQNGRPLAGGKVYFYLPGTETKKDTFQDRAQTIPNTNPVILDSYGEAVIWGNGTYRQILTDANDVQIWDQITEDANAGLVGNMVDDVFVAGDGVTEGTFLPGTTKSFTLTAAPGTPANVWAFFDGFAQHPSQIDGVSGAQLTLVNPVPEGVTEVLFKVGSTVAVGTPGGGTVTDDTVASNAGIQATKLAFTQGGGGAVKRTVQSKLRDIINVIDFGADPTGVSDSTTAINNADAYAASQGGGTVHFPPGVFAVTGLNRTNSNVRWRGAGAETPHDAGTPKPSTTLKYTGVAGGAVVTLQTPRSPTEAIRVGMDLEGFMIDGNELAAFGVLVISVRNCNFEDLYVTNVSTYGYLVSTYPRGDMAEASDTQQCVFNRCTWRLLSAFSNLAVGMHFGADGDNGTANANASFNVVIMCEGQNAKGAAFLLGDCDNNTFIACRAIRTDFTVPGLLINGGDNNYFWGFSSGGSLGIVINGASEGQFHTPVSNCFYSNDTGNGTLYPTCGSGVVVKGLLWEYISLVPTASAGSNGAPPAQVAGYIDIHLPSGGKGKVPYYNE